MTRPTITLLTDFGLQDPYAGVMKGVIAGIAPEALVVDLSHAVPPQDVAAGAFALMTACSYFPAGTVHLAIVDPGVGTDRKVVAVETGRFVFVGPDNGLLRWAVERSGGSRAVVAVENPAYRLPHVSHTFHGRDVMAPAAAHLAMGLPLESLGPRLSGLHGEPFPVPRRRGHQLIGSVVYVDHFGNCITNLALPAAPDGAVAAGRRLEMVRSYADAPPGQPVVVSGSAGFLEVAVNRGSAARTLGLRAGDEVILPIGEPAHD